MLAEDGRRTISQMGPRARQNAEERRDALAACYANTDCQARVKCLVPIIAELHAGEFSKK